MRAVILAALFPEARAIARAFHLPAPPPPSRATPGDSLSDGPIAVRLVGVGAPHLDQILALQPPAVIMAGLAGALAPDLAVGDVVIQGTCPPLPGVRIGALATSSGIVATPADKAALFRQSGALAVDMETAPAQRFAESLRVPFLAVRAISDTAAQSLDPALLSLVDSDGRPRVGRALRQLAAGSVRLPDLLRARRAANLALARLTATLLALVASGWPDRT
jgi:adenosylhomocysteine nucleosidase